MNEHVALAPLRALEKTSIAEESNDVDTSSLQNVRTTGGQYSQDTTAALACVVARIKNVIEDHRAALRQVRVDVTKAKNDLTVTL